MDPTVQHCRAPVPTRSWDLWAESEPIPGLSETELYSQSQESLTSDPPNPRFVRGDQCDWRRRLAWRPVSFVFVFFGIMCIFFRVVICPLCALVFLFTFFQDQILTQLCTHTRQGSQILPFFPNSAQDSWHFCSYLLKALISSGGLSPSSIEVSIPSCWLP